MNCRDIISKLDKATQIEIYHKATDGTYKYSSPQAAIDDNKYFLLTSKISYLKPGTRYLYICTRE